LLNVQYDKTDYSFVKILRQSGSLPEKCIVSI
jgi:hypothetical protein